MRVKAVIAYDGSAFYGFQSQTTTSKTVSGALQSAFKRLGIDSYPVGSGRTDRGVHATGQVIHFDLPKHWQKEVPRVSTLLNRLLKPHIQFKHITAVEPEFHARFDAKRRIYRYVLKKRVPTPFEAPYCRHLPDLEPEKLIPALYLFKGEHDFVHFHKRGSDPNSTVRTIYETSLFTFGNYTIIRFEANGFLRAQVRMMVESAIKVMRGDLQEDIVKRQLEGRKLFNAPLAPPEALYLSRVIY